MNCGPLSDTMVSGRPWSRNTWSRNSRAIAGAGVPFSVSVAVQEMYSSVPKVLGQPGNGTQATVVDTATSVAAYLAK